MDNNSLLAIIAVTIVSLISLAGVFTLGLSSKRLDKITLFLVSLAAGTLIGDAFIHLIPEVYGNENFSNASIFIILGILVFLILEKFLHWTHCHSQTSERHPHPVAIMNLVADGIHNFLDGLIIGAGFLVSPEIGLATTLAVLLHEIPQEIGDFGVLIHSGMKVRRAIFFNFVSALTAIIGVLVSIFIGEISETFILSMISFAAGGFIYIAIADLLPEIKHETETKKSILQLALVILGILIMFGLSFIEPTEGVSDNQSDISIQEQV